MTRTPATDLNVDFGSIVHNLRTTTGALPGEELWVNAESKHELAHESQGYAWVIETCAREIGRGPVDIQEAVEEVSSKIDEEDDDLEYAAATILENALAGDKAGIGRTLEPLTRSDIETVEEEMAYIAGDVLKELAGDKSSMVTGLRAAAAQYVDEDEDATDHVYVLDEEGEEEVEIEDVALDDLDEDEEW
ncbi:MAG: hypothetical protein Q4A71_04190 [Actinomycetaceae bacterium]|nr:hypothetical protein [Actinomycetaceae bacterium]